MVCFANFASFLRFFLSLAVKIVAEQNDLSTFNKYVLESLRFNPFGPGIFRDCIQDYIIAKGSFRSKKIRKGTRVMIATHSAMWDRREIKDPKKLISIGLITNTCMYVVKAFRVDCD